MWSRRVVCGERFELHKSIFLAHATYITSIADALAFHADIKEDKRLKRARHHMLVYTVSGSVGFDQGEESGAGLKLKHLIEQHERCRNEDLAVVVTRFHGGIQLGPQRFKLIVQAANDALIKLLASKPSAY